MAAGTSTAKSNIIYWITDKPAYSRSNVGDSFTLPADVKRAWIKALRSRRYGQASNVLAVVQRSTEEIIQADITLLAIKNPDGTVNLDEARTSHGIKACCLGVYLCENAVGRIGDQPETSIKLGSNGLLEFNWSGPVANRGLVTRTETSMLPRKTAERWGWSERGVDGPLNTLVEYVSRVEYNDWCRRNESANKLNKLTGERVRPTSMAYYRKNNNRVAESLVALNDAGFTFQQIANIIDKQYPGV